jgi:aspartate racemase
MTSRVLGVLGGMGPLATADFLKKLVEETPALCDQDHIPVVAYSVPQIPDRSRAISGQGESPLPYLLEGIDTLKHAGAQGVAIVCNTAHYWYDDLVQQGGLEILHIADAVCAALTGVQRVGLIATSGTVTAGFYQSRFAARNIDCVIGSESDQATLVSPAIECVKRNDLAQAHNLATRAVRCLLAQGTPGPEAVVLGCTEIPLAIAHQPSEVSGRCVDATRALARACVAWSRAATRSASQNPATSPRS